MNRTVFSGAAAALLWVMAQSAVAASAASQAQKLINGGQLDAALAVLDKQLASAPQDAESRFLRGLVLARLDRNEQAIKTFADITRDFPQLPEPYNNLAVIYAKQGEYEKARDALEAALATHPSYATAHENLGDIYSALAGAAYNRALSLDQSNQAVRNKMALINQLNRTQQSPVQVASAPPTPALTQPAPAADVTPTPEPVAAPQPAPPPVIAAAPPASEEPAPPPEAKQVEPDINNAVQAWAKAWSAQDVDAYLASYAPAFQPEGGVSRGAWEAQRRERLKRPSFIRVSVGRAEVSIADDGTASARFLQGYESDSYADEVTKILEMRNVDGWKITREYSR